MNQKLHFVHCQLSFMQCPAKFSDWELRSEIPLHEQYGVIVKFKGIGTSTSQFIVWILLGMCVCMCMCIIHHMMCRYVFMKESDNSCIS